MHTTPIVNGVPWFDDRGEIVNAHGACIVEEDGRYYLFGEHKTDDINTFVGFACYSSTDLATWRFEGLSLPQQPDGLMGRGRVGERVKVMRCPSTGMFVMFMHSDDMQYTDPHICVATSPTLTGEFTFVGDLTYRGAPILRWDVGTFQDEDGVGYLLVHEGDIYRLADDYLSAVERVAEGLAPGGESPAMLRHDGTYFLLLSRKTSWESNDNFYLSAPAVEGPWTARGVFAPAGSRTWSSQCTFVFPLLTDAGLVPMYMGDRWSFPHQASAATSVWMPLEVDGTTLSIPTFWGAWDPRAAREVELVGTPVPVVFSSDVPGDTVEVAVSGHRVAIVGTAQPTGAYARVEIVNAHGAVVTSSWVSFYSQVPDHGYRYLSPQLPEGGCTLRVRVDGEIIEWSDKSGHRFGSIGTRVEVDSLLVLE